MAFFSPGSFNTDVTTHSWGIPIRKPWEMNKSNFFLLLLLITSLVEKLVIFYIGMTNPKSIEARMTIISRSCCFFNRVEKKGLKAINFKWSMDQDSLHSQVNWLGGQLTSVDSYLLEIVLALNPSVVACLVCPVKLRLQSCTGDTWHSNPFNEFAADVAPGLSVASGWIGKG